MNVITNLIQDKSVAETNKCYIIKHDDGGITISTIYGVYSTKEKAEKELYNLAANFGFSRVDYYIEEYEIK